MPGHARLLMDPRYCLHTFTLETAMSGCLLMTRRQGSSYTQLTFFSEKCFRYRQLFERQRHALQMMLFSRPGGYPHEEVRLLRTHGLKGVLSLPNQM